MKKLIVFNLDRRLSGTGNDRLSSLLRWLKEEGYSAALCSGAGLSDLKATLKRLEIDGYFSDLQPVIPGKNEPASLTRLLERQRPDWAVMVGERYFDLEAARENHIPFVGWLSGGGERRELEGADGFIRCPQDLILYLKMRDERAVRMMALDLDGTLTDSEKRITPRTKRALFRFMDQGGILVLASGRPACGIAPVAAELELGQRGGYILSYNGGCITECKTGRTVYQKTLKQEDVRTLARQARTCQVNILTYEGRQIVTEHASDVYSRKESAITQMEIKKVDSFENYVDFPTVKCLLTADAKRLEAVEKRMKGYWKERLSICRSEPFFLEVTADGIDKAESLKRLLEILNLEPSCMAAFGDGFNDCSMIELAGVGVAMGNAQEAVKAAADYIAPSNDEEGVADTVERLFGWEEADDWPFP